MLVIQSIKIFWVGTRITQLLNTWTDDNSLKTFTLQNEAASSDGQDSGEEAELKRKKIEMQKVSVEWEEMEVIVVKYVLYLMNVLVFRFGINSFFMYPLNGGRLPVWANNSVQLLYLGSFKTCWDIV